MWARWSWVRSTPFSSSQRIGRISNTRCGSGEGTTRRKAIAFSELIGDFTAAGAVVVGVSKDAMRNHDKFIAKHGLAVTLVSDAEGALCECYGVWVEKSMYGRKYMGIERSTFVIDGKGVLREAWRKVKVPGHVEEVLAAVEAL